MTARTNQPDPLAPDPLTEEVRRRAADQFGALPRAEADLLVSLIGHYGDAERIAFGTVSILARLYVICDRQLRAADYHRAYRTCMALYRIERDLTRVPPVRTAPARAALVHPTPPAPAPPPEAPAPPTRRELYEQIRAAKRDMQRVRRGRPPLGPATAPPKAAVPAHARAQAPAQPTSGHPPFT